MAAFKEVPVVEVHKGNFKELWPSIILAIQNATFVATDAELTGLGSRKLLFAKSIDERFKEMCKVARTRSIISLGISCFKMVTHEVEGTGATPVADATSKEIEFQVQTFNIWILCNENFTVDPVSVQFLIEHGFDFNKQYATGLPYYRGNDKDCEEAHPSLRQLFTELVRSGVPLVLHNAMVDLIFLYQSFYAEIPSSLQTFTADLSEIFRGGIFDTKYIAEYKARMSASYLEYIFRKCQRDNLNNKQKGQRYTSVQFLSYPPAMRDLVVLPCSLECQSLIGDFSKNICLSYANHGWCSYGNGCHKSHDIDEILDNEDHISAKKKRKRQRKNKNFTAHNLLKEEQKLREGSTSGAAGPTDTEMEQCTQSDGHSQENIEVSDAEDCENNTEVKRQKLSEVSDSEKQSESEENNDIKTETKTGGHRAGFDSFMTGFVFAVFLSRYGTSGNETARGLKDMGLDEFVNKVYLSGKDIPLLIQKGNFSKTSKDHKDKLARISV